MAKRNGAIRRQVYADRYRGRFSFGADASTAVFETFNTGMNVGRTTAFKWTLLAAFIGPNDLADVPGSLVDGGKFAAQLSLGTQTAWLNQDDMQHIASVMSWQDIATEGGAVDHWPYSFPIASPIPLFAQTITIGMQAMNNAAFNSKEFYYELVYVPSSTDETEMLEYLAAFGQI